MIKSMTGFGRAEYQDENRKITVEIKAVNHRYLDFNIRMSKKFSFYEASIRSILKEYMSRGKVDVFITYEDYTQSRVSLKYNEQMAGEYLQYMRRMEDDFKLQRDLSAAVLAGLPEVFTLEEQPVDEQAVWQGIETALRSAAEAFSVSREKEGENLLRDLEEKLDGISRMVDRIEARGPEILAAYRERLETKVRELLEGSQIEEGRIATEVVLYADKICTDEETVRLRSHVEHMGQALREDTGIGRKLDFLAQEMNREANTILSKANDLETANLGIDLKTEIEKIREQIQNIE
ncbi:MAG TPA: YicC family protein [Lachnospiraceae bacterium]|nr:YicC family protein [Lachnospiraceae bacterium]